MKYSSVIASLPRNLRLEDACDYVAGETLLRRLERTGWLKPTVQVSIHMTFREKRERVKGIEPSFPAWEAGVLPLNPQQLNDAIILSRSASGTSNSSSTRSTLRRFTKMISTTTLRNSSRVGLRNIHSMSQSDWRAFADAPPGNGRASRDRARSAQLLRVQN
jgi:hypothetical protein